jgi:hypothetical protein
MWHSTQKKSKTSFNLLIQHNNRVVNLEPHIEQENILNQAH